MGVTFGQLGLLQKSLQSYQEALSLAQASGDALLESEIRSDVGVAGSLAAEVEEALDGALRQCELALEIARQEDGAREEAKALNCLGEVAYNRGDREGALAFYREAQTLWDRLDDLRGRAETLLFQGYVYSDRSDLDQAEACYDRAMPLWTSLRDTRGVAITLVAEARLRQRRGEYQEALNLFGRAQALLERMGDAVWEAASLTGLATVYLHMAETAYALNYWERALKLFETAGLKNYSVDLLMSLGETYLDSGDDTNALDRFERALALGTELGNERWQAYALRFIGVVHLFRQLPTPAVQYFERSLDTQRHFVDPRFEAQTHADLGEAYELLDRHDLAKESFSKSLALSRAARDRAGEAGALYGLARVSAGLDDLSSARGYLERSLSVVESLRTEVESRDLRASYFASVHQYHELHMDVLMRLHERRPRAGLETEAFAASEQARARSLLDSLADARVDLRAGVDPDLLGREQALKGAFEDWARRQRQLVGQPAAGTEVDDLAEEYRDLEERYRQVQAEIRGKSPRYAALTQPLPLRLEEVQAQVLDRKTLLLEYALGEERSFLWAVSNDDHASFELAARAEIESVARRVFELLTARLSVNGNLRERRRRIEQADARYWDEAERLSEMLMGPVADKLKDKTILVVADGALQYLPFAALPLPGRKAERVPMVAEHEIVNLPSASALAVQRRETRGRKMPDRAVAVLADPVFEPDDPRLPAGGPADPSSETERSGELRPDSKQALREAGFLQGVTLSIPRLVSTRQEANAIVTAAPEEMTVKAIDFDASRAIAMSPELARYRIVHFATHGVFDNENPGLSGIILSMFNERGEPQDGFLRMRDIYGLELPVELVVLSACNTALGKQVRGEGLVGIVRGFMYAGAKRVVASLWKVDDEATGELMRHFYQEMLKEGRSPAAALRQAKLTMWRQKRWRSPFYWAAFVLQGEWM
jgi:CHAT domain-containing protein